MDQALAYRKTIQRSCSLSQWLNAYAESWKGKARGVLGGGGPVKVLKERVEEIVQGGASVFEAKLKSRPQDQMHALN